MAKSKTKPYRIKDGHIIHNNEEYFTGDTIELTDEQAALLIVEPADKAPASAPDDKAPLIGSPEAPQDLADPEKTLFDT